MKKVFCILLVLFLIPVFIGCSTEGVAENIPETVLSWTVSTTLTETVTDGVTYQENTFTDAEGLPYKTYALLLDPEKVTLHTGTAENNYDIMPVVRQNVMEQMQASVTDGLDVIAAVNGDFFAISSTFIPSGLSVKDGIILTDNTNWRPYSAVTKDGQFLINDGVNERVDPNTLQMAVGGSWVIVKNGQFNQQSANDALGTTTHPRTLAGVREDGTIILAVIDGRQPALSNGASYEQSAAYMIWLGAKTAINHDGGGSSTMIIRNGDTYQTMNSPSDGNLRQVFCSIQVIKK